MARYVWNVNNNIVALYGTRDSFRCRQRNIDSEGLKVGPFKFISYKEMLRERKKSHRKFYDEIHFDTMAKL